MGVPKFYRWISERYPCLSEVINDAQIPEFDNLYLDMNGIIHNCSHPNDDDVTFRITEEEIFADIFAYLEKLFSLIRPQKVFFMAVDGVAPRAKMNQQRARRFMSARTAEEQIAKAKSRGEEIPTEKRFDSNCITPGTYFMTELNKQLAAWIEKKVENDADWQGIRVYLSGHDCPGEGEHKIMDFIRTERTTDGYDPNTRHCMYGLDADLIMLGMVSHEPHFSLLREEVKFGARRPPPGKGVKKPKKITIAHKSVADITFHLLHLSLLREYLAWEFYPIKNQLSFEYDMERIVDDWVLMGFLVGNDFIPHLPHVHIHDDAFPLLYGTYMQVLPQLDGYINEGGYLNLKRFEIFLKKLAENDRECFLKVMEDQEFIRAKKGQSGVDEEESPEEALVAFSDPDMSSSDDDELSPTSNEDEEDAAFISSDEEEIDDSSNKDPFGGLANASDLLAVEDFDPVEDEFSAAVGLAEFKTMDEKEFENVVQNCWNKAIGNAFKRHKKSYYTEKLRYGNISKTQLKEQAEGYVRAIQWCLHYYYHGCVSWSWYYKHHYAPFLSDIIDFSSMDMTFELSQPFRPFEQLLAVLPAASSECLPPVLRELMCSKESPIADFYPMDFGTDLNGKMAEWEAVVLIPFIDEKRLLNAIATKSQLLSKEENARNCHSGHVLVITDPETKKPVRSLIPRDEFRIDQSRVVWGLLPNVKLDVYFPGFPTMKHLPHTACLRHVNVKVFNQPSKKMSMVLRVEEQEYLQNDLLESAFDLIGKEVCMNWPILKIGKVDSLWSVDKKYDIQKYDEVTMSDLNNTEKAKLQMIISEESDRLMGRYGIDAGEVKGIALVRRFMGVTYEVVDGNVIPVKQWSSPDKAVPVLLPLLVTNIMVEEGKRLSEMPVEAAFPKYSKVFVMDPTWAGFGFLAMVDEVVNTGKPDCRVIVMSSLSEQPNLRAVHENYHTLSMSWMNNFEAAKLSGFMHRLFSRITGTVFLCTGDKKDETPSFSFANKINIGLNLKSTKQNLEIADYTRRTRDGYWQYSMFCVRLLMEYRNKFRDLMSYLEKADSADDVYYASDVWGNEKKRAERLAELNEYLASIPTASLEKQEGGSQYVDSVMMEHVDLAVKSISSKSEMRRGIVNPAKLYRPELRHGNVLPDPDADFHLLDRVVNVSCRENVPVGLQGTVISITKHKIEVLFDRTFKGAVCIRTSLCQCGRVSISSLLNITYGKYRKEMKSPIQPALTPSRLPAGKDKKYGYGDNVWKTNKRHNEKKGEEEEKKEAIQGKKRDLTPGPSKEDREKSEDFSKKNKRKSKKEEDNQHCQPKAEEKQMIPRAVRHLLLNKKKQTEEVTEKCSNKKIEEELVSLLGIPSVSENDSTFTNAKEESVKEKGAKSAKFEENAPHSEMTEEKDSESKKTDGKEATIQDVQNQICSMLSIGTENRESVKEKPIEEEKQQKEGGRQILALFQRNVSADEEKVVEYEDSSIQSDKEKKQPSALKAIFQSAEDTKKNQKPVSSKNSSKGEGKNRPADGFWMDKRKSKIDNPPPPPLQHHNNHNHHQRHPLPLGPNSINIRIPPPNTLPLQSLPHSPIRQFGIPPPVTMHPPFFTMPPPPYGLHPPGPPPSHTPLPHAHLPHAPPQRGGFHQMNQQRRSPPVGRPNANVNQRHNNSDNKVKLTDLKPSTVSMPRQKKAGKKKFTRSTEKSLSIEQEVDGLSILDKKEEESTAPSPPSSPVHSPLVQSIPSSAILKPKRASRLAAKFTSSC